MTPRRSIAEEDLLYEAAVLREVLDLYPFLAALDELLLMTTANLPGNEGDGESRKQAIRELLRYGLIRCDQSGAVSPTLPALRFAELFELP